MGKTYTPQPITSETNFKLTLNNNLDAIESALDKALSRDGETPNQMNADLDMNSNDILNVSNVFLADGLKEPLVIDDDYTLVNADRFRFIRAEDTLEVTIPDDSEIPSGWYCHIQKATTGFVTFTAEAGVTLEVVDDSREILEQWGWITVIKLDEDTWAVTGNLA